MFARRCLLAVVATAAMVVAATAADPALPDGKYVVAYGSTATILQRTVVFELKTADGKTTAKTVNGGPAKWEVTGYKVADGVITIGIGGPAKLTFEGKVDAKGEKALGTFGDDDRLFRGTVSKTDIGEITQQNTVEQVPAPDDMKEWAKLRTAPLVLQNQARQEKDADKRKELLDQAKDAKAKFDTEGPKLLQKVVEGAGTDAGVLYFATPDLLAAAGAMKAKPDDAKKWAEIGLKAAAAHGPRAERNALLGTASVLSRQEGLGAVALAYAEKAVAATEKGPLAAKVNAMKALAAAQAKAGKADAAKATTAAVDKLETELDVEYKKTSLGFTPEKYEGRKNKDANRVAVFEMFTGAMCPPCVAADLAFDGLEEVYTPKDLILLQYHQHIPGPDPMTNPDTLARWAYYTKLFPQDVRGVPCSVFDGKPQALGGGGKPNANNKYDQYKKVIDETLEKKTDVTIAGSAKLEGGEVKVDATITKADAATVRIVLAEEEVRYLGGNGIRLHHQVVRSMFGKPEGWKVKELKDGKASVSVKLDDLKKALAEYMETYNKERPFSSPDRPLKFEHLNVVVLVQDDETGEILNAAQFAVGGKK